MVYDKLIKYPIKQRLFLFFVCGIGIRSRVNAPGARIHELGVHTGPVGQCSGIVSMRASKRPIRRGRRGLREGALDAEKFT